MHVIGLCGQAGAGKDFVYRKIERWLTALGETSLRVSLADNVRLEVEGYLNEGRYLPKLWEKPYSTEVRRLLQWWGTDFRRAEDEDHWVNITAGEIEDIERENETDVVVVTDIRFGNEADMIRSFGGLLLQVTASRDTLKERLGGEVAPSHPSEVIDFATNGVILNEDSPIFPPNLVRLLGGDSQCYHCCRLHAPHPWHDNGRTFEPGVVSLNG